MPKPSQKPPAKIKCVCCNAPTKKHKSHLVFDEYGKFRRIQFLLAECLNKKVIEVAGGQQSICVDCLNQLDLNYAFKLKCSKQSNDQDETEGSNDESEQSDEDAHEESIVDEDVADYGDDDKFNVVVKEAENVLLPPPKFEIELSETADDDHLNGIKEEIEEKTNEIDVESTMSLDQPEISTTSIPDEYMMVNKVDNSSSVNLENEDHIEYEEIEHFEEIHHDQIEDESSTSICYESGDQRHETADDYTEMVFADPTEYDFVMNESPPPTISTSFIDSLTLHSVKEIIRKGIPTHCLSLPPEPKIIDRNKQHFSRSNTFNARHHEQGLVDHNSREDDDDVDEKILVDEEEFVPELQIEQIQCFAESEPADLDDYVRNIASVSFCEFSPFIGNPVCKVFIIFPFV